MIFTKRPPKDFHANVEVVSCFCEYNGRILLLRRQSHKQYGNTWGPPAGKINESESPTEAMVRELQEESGITALENELKHSGKFLVRYPEYDFVFHIFHLPLKEIPEVKIKEEEHRAYQWFLPEEALKRELIRDEDEVIKRFFKI